MTWPLRILYLGDDYPHSTSLHRAEALKRIGCEVEILNPKRAYAHLRIHRKFHYMTGYRFVSPLAHRWLDRQTRGKQFDLVWTSQCPELSIRSVLLLHERFSRVISYINDDPTGTRDGNNWATFCMGIPCYNLCVVIRVESDREFRQRGAQRVLRVWMSYDEVAHAPFPSDEAVPPAFRSDVAFIGTWMKGEGQSGRDYFLLKLIEAGIPISIWGNRWQKAPGWLKIKPYWRGEGLGGRDYVAAMQGAKICLGFLSKGNRDLHTRRSVEIPYAGGLLCAERTSEHLQMYQEGVEAVFWSSAEECINVCRDLLNDEPRRRQIREAGMKRIRSLGLGNETVCRKILSELGYTEYVNAEIAKLYRLQSIRE